MFPTQSDISQLSSREKRELVALVDRIVDSGALGRSKTYREILRYLAACRIDGISPRETSIAVDVMAKGDDFDISRDSSVRVYMYQLRNKLDDYFQEQGMHEKFVLTVPKGQYGLAITLRDGVTLEQNADAAFTPAAADAGWLHSFGKRQRQTYFMMAVAGIAIITLALNFQRLLEFARSAMPGQAAMAQNEELIGRYEFWGNILDDDLPVMILIGDYLAFGEQEEPRPPARGKYIPMGTADALANLMPFLKLHSREVQIKMMSQLETADLVTHHIVYVGMLGRLSQLQDLMFAASGLAVGATSDTLYAANEKREFHGNFDLSGTGDGFRDYGMLSTFVAPRGNQFIMLAGMSDAGLVAVVERAVDPQSLGSLSDALGVSTGDMDVFEALYEVVGLRDTSFHTRLVHSQLRDSAAIWNSKLTSEPKH
jgi:hypothetical protein